MPVSVDELNTVVETQAVPQEERGTGAAASWEELERLRALRARLQQDALRIRAREYDD